MGRTAKSRTAVERNVGADPSRSGAAAPSRAAGRLLKALAAQGATTRPDPTRPDTIIVQGATGTVSLGRGSHACDALAELARSGLVEEAERDRRDRFVITEAGRAHLRRAGAAEPDAGFGAQHRDLVTATVVRDGDVERVAVNAQESPLAWLRRRRDRDGEPLIDAAAFEAGERLRRDLTLAQLLPSVTARWDGAIGSGGGAPRDPAGATDTVVAARQRVRGALTAVGGDFADLLVDLCGFLKGLELIERERSWPSRSAKIVVRLALRRLAQHYGLDAEARGPVRSRGILAWNAAPEGAADHAGPAATRLASA